MNKKDLKEAAICFVIVIAMCMVIMAIISIDTIETAGFAIWLEGVIFYGTIFGMTTFLCLVAFGVYCAIKDYYREKKENEEK